MAHISRIQCFSVWLSVYLCCCDYRALVKHLGTQQHRNQSARLPSPLNMASPVRQNLLCECNISEAASTSGRLPAAFGVPAVCRRRYQHWRQAPYPAAKTAPAGAAGPHLARPGLHSLAGSNIVADVSEMNAAGIILPAVGFLAGAAALKFFLYSRLEYITAAMLTKYVPKGGRGATVIQLGGGTRELYYYPKDTMTVIHVGEKANKGLMEQAGVTAAVPTIVKQQPITELGFQADSSVDAVVALGVLSQLNWQQRQQCLEEIARVLKPGMPLVYIEPVQEGASPIRWLIGASASKQALSDAELKALQGGPRFNYAEHDIALQGQDPHAVGIAVKSQAYVPKQQQDDKETKRRKDRKTKTAKGFSA